jgi:hypothetical protein
MGLAPTTGNGISALLADERAKRKRPDVAQGAAGTGDFREEGLSVGHGECGWGVGAANRQLQCAACPITLPQAHRKLNQKMRLFGDFSLRLNGSG